jgi:hypothetical protein
MIRIGICENGDRRPPKPESLVAQGGANPPGVIGERTRAPQVAFANC